MMQEGQQAILMASILSSSIQTKGKGRSQLLPMNPLCRSPGTLSLKSTLLLPLSPNGQSRSTQTHPKVHTFPLLLRPTKRLIICSSDAPPPLQHSDIHMVRTKQGVYAPRQKKVLVLWDLDNKPPRGPPYRAANSLKQVAGNFGDAVEVSAYANRHAFVHLPRWVVEERRERRHLDILERKGIVSPAQPHVCSVCGRKCKTNVELRKHFRTLHEREREKKLNRMRQLKGKKRRKYKERFIDGNDKYREAERALITPRVGYGLDRELRRAGVFVRTVEDRPQSADWAVKRQMEHKMRSGGVHWLVLVSDDGDFADMVRKAREAKVGTLVVGDRDGALGRCADLWIPWSEVESGQVRKEDLVTRRRVDEEENDEGFVSISVFDEDVEELSGELDGVIDEAFGRRSEFGGTRISVFSEGEEEEEWGSERDGEEDDYIFDSEDETSDYGFFI